MKSDHPSGPRRLRRQTTRGTKLHPLDWVVESDAVEDVLNEMDGRLRRRRHRCLGAITGGAIALLVAGFGWHYVSQPPSLNEGRLASSALVSLPERQILSDGSIIELRNGAQIAIAFTDSIRRVVLTRGEAHFQVAKMAKPFVVAVGHVEFRAVGTAFAVQLSGARVDVVVTEGRVAVEQPASVSATFPDAVSSDPNPPRTVVALVPAGNRFVASTDAAEGSLSSSEVLPVEAAELAARLAWRAPRLEFSRTPLSEALALMKQHAAAGKNVTVTMSDPSLGRVQVSGVLRADNIGTLLRLLEEEHGIKAEYRSPYEVVLRQGKGR
ncbi:MAG: hypothetical protein EXS37_17765 [Opitutus sp.]|nr:hypothetical protein [Opitutus sp.]